MSVSACHVLQCPSPSNLSSLLPRVLMMMMMIYTFPILRSGVCIDQRINHFPGYYAGQSLAGCSITSILPAHMFSAQPFQMLCIPCFPTTCCLVLSLLSCTKQLLQKGSRSALSTRLSGCLRAACRSALGVYNRLLPDMH